MDNNEIPKEITVKEPTTTKANVNNKKKKSKEKKKKMQPRNNSSLKEKDKKNTQTQEDNKNDFFLDDIELIQNIKKAKEFKDLEKIFQKWNNEKVSVFMKNKEEKEMKYKELLNNISDLSHSCEIKNNKLKLKALEEVKEKEKKLKKKENKKIVDRVKELRKEKDNEKDSELTNEDKEKMEKKMKKQLTNIYKQSNLILDRNNLRRDNLYEQFEYIIEVDNYIKNEIKLNKDENLISPEEATENNEDIIINFLGYFGSELASKKINVLIEKNPTKEKLRDITFKIITAGFATQKIYKLSLNNDKLIIDFNENVQKWFSYLNDVKRRISTIFYIPEDNIYFFNNNLAKYEASLFIYKEKLVGLERILKNYHLTTTTSTLMNNLILSTSMFNITFTKNVEEWPKDNLVRGKKTYYPPFGWIGLALKIDNKFNTKDNIWIGKEDKKGEWPVAYHGINSGDVLKKVLSIINNNLKVGQTQFYKHFTNVGKNSDKYSVCGEGVYLSPNIKSAMEYADKISLGGSSKKFQFVIMARVNPDKIRIPSGAENNWILNASDEEIRPYRLLVKTY